MQVFKWKTMIRERVEKLQVHLFKWLISNFSFCFRTCMLLKDSSIHLSQTV